MSTIQDNSDTLYEAAYILLGLPKRSDADIEAGIVLLAHSRNMLLPDDDSRIILPACGVQLTGGLECELAPGHDGPCNAHLFAP